MGQIVMARVFFFSYCNTCCVPFHMKEWNVYKKYNDERLILIGKIIETVLEDRSKNLMA